MKLVHANISKNKVCILTAVSWLFLLQTVVSFVRTFIKKADDRKFCPFMVIINSGLVDLSMNDPTLYFYPFLHNVFLTTSRFLK